MDQTFCINMRSLSTFFNLLLFFLFTNVNGAREGPREYWKSIMNEKPIPEVLKDLIYQDPASQFDKKQTLQKDSGTLNMDYFIREFGTKPNLIIYHSRVDTQVFTEDYKLGTVPRWKKSNLKHVKLRRSVPEV